MLKVEFHCHSIYSKDGLMPLDDLLKLAQKRGIDRLAITDHNTTRGAFAAKKLAPDIVIVGEEIMTTKGELLGYYMKEEIPAGLEPFEVLRRLREQGAFISVSHPFDLQRKGWLLPDLLEIIPQVDAIEVFNSRCLFNSTNQAAADFAEQNHLNGTVGSDAHIAFELGRSTLNLPEFNSAEELRSVLHLAEQKTRLSPFWVHFGSTYAKYAKKLLKKKRV